ncbi:MAG: undecaprenyldiphospho-muramoylpentapeptide beta-N-acetylglucosaminyltransferase, partial [Bacteroidales bacterium]|nr:undecaprenyldiphospho-muramoylpentapeptide beta-N-acetylglucosaminyltransferase [Bacteroidales bacterium]
PDTEILFVGAEGKIEMQKVPAAGYQIKSLPIRGFQRKLSIHNISVIVGLFKSLSKSKKIIKEFKPDAVIGVGGYASGPVVYKASKMGIPTLLQEQNSYAGITNKLLAKRAKKICVAYDGMEKFFDREKIIKTGNPIRKDLYNSNIKKQEALAFFELEASKKTILILGGSGGARTINEAVIQQLEAINSSSVQIIWQTGKFYYQQSFQALKNYSGNNIKVYDFINKMDMAFVAADVVVSRSGAGTISELCLVKKPSILVPSPNVAEDHQTKNAMALVEKEAALLVKDNEAKDILIPKAIELTKNNDLMENLSQNISNLAIANSDELIANEILKLCAMH